MTYGIVCRDQLKLSFFYASSPDQYEAEGQSHEGRNSAAAWNDGGSDCMPRPTGTSTGTTNECQNRKRCRRDRKISEIEPERRQPVPEAKHGWSRVP